jgi:hypothetical protein
MQLRYGEIEVAFQLFSCGMVWAIEGKQEQQRWRKEHGF